MPTPENLLPPHQDLERRRILLGARPRLVLVDEDPQLVAVGRSGGEDLGADAERREVEVRLLVGAGEIEGKGARGGEVHVSDGSGGDQDGLARRTRCR